MYERPARTYDRNFLIVLVGCPFIDHRLWSHVHQRWTRDFGQAYIYNTYGDVSRAIWSIPPRKLMSAEKLYTEKWNLRAHAMPLTFYRHYMALISSGKWDGIVDLPVALEYNGL